MSPAKAAALPAPRSRDEKRHVTSNRRARHEYNIEETFEAGMVLTGTEIKSIRAGKVNLQASYARIENGELNAYHSALYQDYFCANKMPQGSTRQILENIRFHRTAMTQLR